MHCPYCKSRSVHQYGGTFKGRQPYQCQDCQRIFKKTGGSALWWVVGCLIFLGLSPSIINQVLQIAIARPDTGETADAIVVLGRGPAKNGERTLAAAQLLTQGRASRVFMSGMTDAPVMIKLAKDMGVPANQVSGERCSQSTWENALFSDILLSPQGTQKILLVTDDTHIPRATLTFRRLGFEVVPYPVETKFSIHQIRHGFRESFGIAFYSLSGKLQPLKDDAKQSAQIEANSKIKKWKCSLSNQ